MSSNVAFLLAWGTGFGTLCGSLALLAICSRVVDLQITFLSLRTEVALALIASLGQAGNYWVVKHVLLLDSIRAEFFVGAIFAVVLYYISHLREWYGYEVAILLTTQGLLYALTLAIQHRDFSVAVILGLAQIVLLACARSILKLFD